MLGKQKVKQIIKRDTEKEKEVLCLENNTGIPGRDVMPLALKGLAGRDAPTKQQAIGQRATLSM